MRKFYYKVAGHTFSVNKEMAKRYQPFATKPKRTVFDLTISEGKIPPGLCIQTQKQVEDDMTIIAGTKNGIPFFEFRLGRWMTGFLITSSNYRRGELHIMLAEKFSIDTALMIMYALSTACYNTLLFHASVIKRNDLGYLFLGKSGTGKSTHSRLWINNIPGSRLLNDDNPVVRIGKDGVARVYGSPWSGKTPCYKQESATVAGIAELEQWPGNETVNLTDNEAYKLIIRSVSGIRWNKHIVQGQRECAISIMSQVPIFHLRCRPNAEAAYMCNYRMSM